MQGPHLHGSRLLGEHRCSSSPGGCCTLFRSNVKSKIKQNHQVLLELVPICKKKKKWLGTNVFIKGAPASPFSCRERWWQLEIRTVLRRSSQQSRKSPDKINFFPYRAVRATNQCYFLLPILFPRPPQAWVWGQLCSAQLLCAQRWAKHGICLWKGAKLCLQTLEKINIKHLTLHPI